MKVRRGMPVFLRMSVLPNSTAPTAGLDGPTAGESSYNMVVGRLAEEKSFRPQELSRAGPPTGQYYMVPLPDRDPRPREMLDFVIPYWFVPDPEKPGSQKLALPVPDSYAVHVRFEHVQRPPRSDQPGEWYVVASHNPAVIKVDYDPDPAAAAFLAAITPIMRDRHVVGPDGRETLRRLVRDEPQPRWTWAAWLLLRSYAMDPDWWRAIRARDARAVAGLPELVALADGIAADPETNWTPPRYDALTVRAAAAEAAGRRDEALGILADVRPRYAGQMLSRGEVGLGEPLPPGVKAVPAGGR